MTTLTLTTTDFGDGSFVVPSAKFRGFWRAHKPDGVMVRETDEHGVVGPGLYTSEGAAVAALRAAGFARPVPPAGAAGRGEG